MNNFVPLILKFYPKTIGVLNFNPALRYISGPSWQQLDNPKL